MFGMINEQVDFVFCGGLAFGGVDMLEKMDVFFENRLGAELIIYNLMIVTVFVAAAVMTAVTG